MTEVRRVVDSVAEIIRSMGAEAVTFHDNVSDDQSENVRRLTDWHNSQDRDLDCQIHMNAHQETIEPRGSECWYVSDGTEELAARVSAGIAGAARLPDRGAKQTDDLYFLNKTDQKAILIEVVFVDSKADAEAYRDRFPSICVALASAILARFVARPPTVPEMQRPTIKDGDYGSLVRLVQECLMAEPFDSMFGPETEKAVKQFQGSNGLDADGVVGPETWDKLGHEFDLPPYPTPMLEPLDEEIIDEIEMAAEDSDVADLLWDDRGVAPLGYIVGTAFAYATMVRKFENNDLTAHEIAKAETGDTEHDALALYRDQFQRLGMGNSIAGRDVLRHVFVFLLGLGMRESSGKHCCGRDQSADNVQAETCEAGLFQTSWNYHVCATDAETLMAEYEHALRGREPQCQLAAFADGVSCSAEDWQNYGSGKGAYFQELTKLCPAFACESAAVAIRNICKHYGPVVRGEVQITPEADELFAEIDEILAAAEDTA